MDCVGLNGYRNITMWRNEHHIEIICKTDVEDIFLYESCPKKGQEFY